MPFPFGPEPNVTQSWKLIQTPDTSMWFKLLSISSSVIVTGSWESEYYLRRCWYLFFTGVILIILISLRQGRLMINTMSVCAVYNYVIIYSWRTNYCINDIYKIFHTINGWFRKIIMEYSMEGQDQPSHLLNKNRKDKIV